MKITNLIVLVLCIAFFSACKPKEKEVKAEVAAISTVAYKTGDKIQVLWGSSYYPSTVVEIGSNDKSGKYKIHYEGWSSGSDEWVAPNRIRSADIQDGKVVAVRGSSNTATTTEVAKTETSTTTNTVVYKQNDKIQVLWGSSYYPSSVVEIGSNDKSGKYKIHYEGWSSGSDEWVTPDRIRSADIQDGKVVAVRGSKK